MSRQLPLNLRLKDSSSFENFLPATNREAVARLHAAVAALARGRAPEPVLFLCGAPGTGRTHLLQAACREAQSAGGSALYIPFSEIAALAPAMLEDLEQAALVCLDDIERIAGKTDWEAAVFALCERLRASGGMLLVAGARPPRELGLQLPDLATRLGWGPVYALAPLGDDERLEAVRLRARNRGLEMPEEVARYILARYPRDLDSLFALLDRLDVASLAEQRRLTIPFLRSFDSRDDVMDGGRSGPSSPSRGITPSLEGRGTTSGKKDDCKDAGGRASSGTNAEVERRLEQPPGTASGDGRDAGDRATPEAVAGTATEEEGKA